MIDELLAERASRDTGRVAAIGLKAAQRTLGRVRLGAERMLRRPGERFSVRRELSLHLAPVLARAMAHAHAMGHRRAGLNLDAACREAALSLAWDESQHPRAEAGTSAGGEFVSSELAHPHRPAGLAPTSRAVKRVLESAAVGAKFSERGAKAERRAIATLRPSEPDQMEPRPELVEKYRKGWPVDPPVVNAAGVILDGHHRVASAHAAGRIDIFVVAVKGNAEEGYDFGLVRPTAQLDLYSDLRKVLRRTSVPDVAGLEHAYAGRAVEVLNELGDSVDPKLLAAVVELQESGGSFGSAQSLLRSALDLMGVGPAGQSRIETVFATEVAVAAGVGEWLGYQDGWDRLWGFRYVQLDRPTKRAEHEPFDGVTLPKDDPFWKRHWPPNGWNCGCKAVPIPKSPYRYLRFPVKRYKGGGSVDDGFGKNPGAILDEALEFAWDESQHPRDRYGKFAEKSPEARLADAEPAFVPWKDAVTVDSLGLKFDDGDGFVDSLAPEAEDAIQRATEEREFSADQLEATQHIVRRKQVREALKRDPEADRRFGLPVVAKFEDRLYVVDGTHRVVADGLLGRKTLATYVDLDEVYDALSFDWQSQARDPAGTPTGGQWTKEQAWPELGVEDPAMAHSKALGGSTGAELWVDDEGGRWVMKKGASAGHVENEHWANQAYRALGVHAPESRLYKHSDGSTYMLSKYVEGKPLSALSGQERKHAEVLLAKDFAADALLANWDVVGLNYDNVIVDKAGNPWRIDNGGAMAYRAKGAKKPPSMWSESTTVGELETMRKQGTAGQVFGKLSDEGVKAQISKFAPGFSTKIEKLDKSVRDVLDKRMAAAMEWHAFSGKLAPTPGKAAVTPVKLASGAPWMGATPQDRFKFLKSKLKLMGREQYKYTAVLNDGADNESFITLKSLKPHQLDEVKQVFSDKKLKLVAKKDLTEKFGTTKNKTVSEFWNKAKASTEVLSDKLKKTGITLQAKAIAAADPEISAAMKAKIAAMPTVAAYASQEEMHSAEYSGSKWSRPKVTTGGSLSDRTEKGNVSEIAHEQAAWLESLKGSEQGAFSRWGGSAYGIRAAEVAAAYGASDKDVSSVHVDYAHYVGPMHDAQDRAPKYEGVLYRGVKHVVPGSTFYDALQTVGSTVKLKASACSSRWLGKGAQFGSGTCVLRVASKSGVNVELAAKHPYEKEVQLKRGTKYRVAAVAHDVTLAGVKTHLMVDLEEMGQDEDVEHELLLSQPIALSISGVVEEDVDRSARFCETDPDLFLEVRKYLGRV